MKKNCTKSSVDTRIYRWKKILLIMRIVVVLLLFKLTTLATNTYSQKANFNMNFTNVSLNEIINNIQEQSEFTFLYNHEQVNKESLVSVNIENGTIIEVLEKCLTGTQLGFHIEEDIIVISPKIEAPEIVSIIKIKGIIKVQDGTPLPGATILEKETMNGVVTDADGNFTLTISESTSILVVSFIGFTTKEIIVGNNTEFNIVLEESSTALDEVVVTGYQTLSKARMTGSFSKITTEDLERTISFSIEDKIVDGTVAGLLSGPLGITIRGVSTLNASRLPLIVVDGFPLQIDKDEFDNLDEYGDGDEFGALTRALESINPNDVESVTVLKDAAAASIWGARAANGVIVITTKTTASQEPQIEFSSSIAWKPIPDVSKLPYASPETYFELEKGRYDAGWMDSFLSKMDKYKYNVSDYAYTRYRVEQGVMDATELTAIEQQMKTYDNRYEFSDLFLRSSLHQQYNLSVSQNTGFNNYRFSISYDTDASSSKQNDNNRLVLNFRNQFKPEKWLIAYVGANISLKGEKKNGVDLKDLFYVAQHQHFLDVNGDYTSMASFQISSTSYGKHFREFASEMTPYIPYDWEWNTKREFDNKDNTVRTVDLRLQSGITIKPFGEMLKLNFKYQYERGSVKTANYYNEEMWVTRHKVNTFAQPDGSLPVPKGGILDHFYNTSYSHDFMATAHFIKKFAKKHQVVTLIGVEIRDQKNDKSNVRRYGYDPQSLSWANQIDYASRIPRNEYLFRGYAYYIESAWSNIYNYWERQDRYTSLFANFAYTYNDRYDITGSWRLDKSNMFGDSPQYREIPLWSLGIGWTINKEDFFDVSFISRLRFRATYGSSGNVDKSTSPYAIANIGGSYTNTYLQLPGASYRNPANPELRWEKTRQLNLAIEFSMFDNRINGEIEYYNKSSEDLLTTIKINTTYGFQTALLNLGAMRNRGIDLTLSATVIKNSEFMWRTQLTQSYNQNKVVRTDRSGIVVSLPNILRYDSYRLAEGKPRFYAMSIPWAGLSNEGYPQFVLKDTVNSYPMPSQPLYRESGYDDLQYEGPTQAPWYGSWSNIFRYKNWEFSFLCSYKFGHVYKHQSLNDIANNGLYGIAQGNFVPHYYVDFNNMWREPGDEAFTDIPKLPFEFTGTSGKRNSTWYTYPTQFGSHQFLSAAHIRLQRVTIAYSLKKNRLPKGIKRVSFQLQGRNLAIITFNKYNEDSEHLADMYGNFILATLPQFTFSIKAMF
jgi:TonB-linked SusC/RagA family outer membrane protein